MRLTKTFDPAWFRGCSDPATAAFHYGFLFWNRDHDDYSQLVARFKDDFPRVAAEAVEQLESE